MTIIATQLSNKWLQVSWTDTPDPVNGFTISLGVFPNPPVPVGNVAGFIRSWVQTETMWTTGDVVAFVVTNEDTLDTQTIELTIRDLDAPYTYGPVNSLETTARYTTVDSVKNRLMIPLSDTSRDDEILQAIIATEYSMDVHFGRSFPDMGNNPRVPGIPEAVKSAALAIAVAVWKEADAPGGSIGSDDFFGSIDITETTRQILSRSPILSGFMVSWGTG